MDLHVLLTEFRLAGRELFNRYFRIENPYENDGWEAESRFSKVESVLFENLVAVPAGLALAPYGEVQSQIRVVLRHGDSAPIMVNRSADSGYWDDPVREFNSGCDFRFLSFFDWDILSVRDSMYVRVVVESWPGYAGLVGRQALVETQYVRFVKP